MVTSLSQHPVGLQEVGVKVPTQQGLEDRGWWGSQAAVRVRTQHQAPGSYWKEVQVSSPLQSQRVELTKDSDDTPAPLEPREVPGPEPGNTKQQSNKLSQSLKHTAHTPDRCQEKGSMTYQQPALHKNKCLNPIGQALKVPRQELWGAWCPSASQSEWLPIHVWVPMQCWVHSRHSIYASAGLVPLL